MIHKGWLKNTHGVNIQLRTLVDSQKFQLMYVYFKTYLVVSRFQRYMNR